MSYRISVVGLGKLGCTMASCFASRGFQTIGVDMNQSFVDKVNAGESPIYEPGVDELIKANRERLSATTDTKQAILDTDVTFIIVPTPSTKDGSFSNSYIERALVPISEALKEKNSYHLIIITSTVSPGSTEGFKYTLEENTGKVCGEDFSIIYSPDFIALGKIIHDFMNPDMILIGEHDEKAGDILVSIHKQLVLNNPEFHRMSTYNAELAKIGLNAYCTLKITFANVVGEICEAMPTGDAEKVLMAIGADSRVGKKYFKPGLGFSGPCFPRDNRAFKQFANSQGVNYCFAELTDDINNYHKQIRIPQILINILDEKAKREIAVLGLSYKEDINVTEESAAIEAIKQLVKNGVSVRVYDPASNEVAKKELGDYSEVTFCDSIKECLVGVSVCFIGTPWKQFKGITLEDLLDLMGENPTIFDSWGIFKNTEIESSTDIDYRRVGKIYADIKALMPYLQIDNE